MTWGWGLGRGGQGRQSEEREHLNWDPKNELESDIPKCGFPLQSSKVRESPDCAYEGVGWGEGDWEKLAPQILPPGMCGGRAVREGTGAPSGPSNVEPTSLHHQTGSLREPEEGYIAGMAQTGRTGEQSPHPCGRPFPCGNLCPELPDTLIFQEKPYVWICTQSFQNYKHWLYLKFIKALCEPSKTYHSTGFWFVISKEKSWKPWERVASLP